MSGVSREELTGWITAALAAYDGEVRAAWARIRLDPERWRSSPWSDDDGGFWAVALDGDQVLWFNEIEEGFNWSPWSSRGTIGEYGCNQTTFEEILERIAQAHSAAARATLRESEVPADVAGPGSIVQRQTTYWEVRAATQAHYRIHFRDKVEAAFATAPYASVELTSHHPLLVQYDDPMQSLYFSGTAIDARALAEQLERTIRAASHAWRGLADHGETVGGIERRLRAGHGMLMSAPASVCVAIAAALEEAGGRASILGGAPARPGTRVLLLGRSYVVASGFAFEPRGRS